MCVFCVAFLVVLASPVFLYIFGWNFVILGVFLGWGGPQRPGGVPLGMQSPSEIMFGCFLDDVRLLWGSPEGHFGGNFGRMFANPSDNVDFGVILLRSGKMSESGAP